jgi:Tol biopolymer transport system component
MSASTGLCGGQREIVVPTATALHTKLEREVAIKVLPAALASDPDRLVRFEREAKMLAQLNHPGIAAIHGVEDRALVMELVPGPTLADRIKQGPIPADEVETMLLQIAEALEYAHERGVIHRDLKPANIKIDPDDRVKILDFGLAKALTDPGNSVVSDPTNSPTVTMGETVAGTILGTAAYMAPEQARGKRVDKRADIWAFGVVAWEMLMGERLFQGEDTVQVLSRVLEQPVDVERAPARFQKMLGRCLDRNPKERLRDIGEVRFLLGEPESGAGSPEQAARLTHTARSSKLSSIVAVALALGLGALTFVHFRQKIPTPELMRFEIPAPGGAALSNDLALSPDGRKLAFLATGKQGSQMVWVRPLDANEARPLPGTEGAAFAFIWSPDSRSVAFASGGQLKKIEVAGGPAQTICAAAVLIDGFWTPDNKIVYGTLGPIFQVSASGGTPAQLTAPNPSRGDVVHVPGTLLPDGRHFLYSGLTLSANENTGIYVGSLDAKPEQQSTKKLLPDDSSVRYVPSAEAAPAPGFLLFVRTTGVFSSGALMAQPFDPKRLELSGDAVPVAEQVSSLQGFSASSNGKLAYRAGVAQADQLTWMDRSGKATATTAPPGIYNNFRLAPDDKRVAFDRPDDVWVMDLVRGVPSRLTFGPAVSNLPIWSPDGLRILYPNRRRGVFDLYIKPANGAGQEEVMVKLGTPTGWATSWSRDGRYVLYQIPSDKIRQELWIAPQFEDRKPFPYLQTQFNEQEAVFSPDGHWVAYVSDETGRDEIYVQAFPPSGAKFQISAGGGFEPLWRKDGTELFYVEADRNLMAVPVKFTPTFDAGVPKLLFPLPNTAVSGGRHRYAVAGDGQRFLVATSPGAATQAASSAFQVVLNWTQMLKK